MKFAVKPSLPILVAALAIVLTFAPSASAAGTVTVNINGKGDVSGDGVACSEAGGADCSEAYTDDEVQDCDPERKPPCITISSPPTVSFTAGADRNGYAFSNWTGCTTATNRTCELTVDSDRTVTANFSDVSVPSVSNLSPASGVRSGTITLSATATDNSGTVTKVDFSVGGVTVSDTSAPYSISFNTASVSDGFKTVSATAFDPSGSSATISGGITVDNTAPGLSVGSGPNGQTFGPGSTQSWSFTATDTTSGIQSVQCSVVPSGQAPSFGACSGGSGSHSVTGRPDGSHTFTVRVRDNAGHETTQTRAFAIDATPPDTSITGGPGEGSSTSGDVTFTFGSSEPGSSFVCRVSPSGVTPGAFAPCSGPGSHTAQGLAPGTYTFGVVATDPYGNVDGAPATRTFTVVPAGTDGGAGTGDDGSGGGLQNPTGAVTLEQLTAALQGDLAAAAGPLSRTRLSTLRRQGRFVVRLRALTAGRLVVTLTGSVSRRARGAAAPVLARGAKTVLAPGTYKVIVRLTKKARRSLLGARSLSGKLSVRFTDAKGQAVTRARAVKLRRR